MSRKNTRLKLKKMTTLTVFLAVSLCISLAESFFPPLVPIPDLPMWSLYFYYMISLREKRFSFS